MLITSTEALGLFAIRERQRSQTVRLRHNEVRAGAVRRDHRIRRQVPAESRIITVGGGREDQVAAPGESRREDVRMAERQFRLPGSSYEELVNIIVAYGTRDEAARPGDVGKLDAVHQRSVSRNKAFLTEIGVLQGESKKLITRRGRSLALALARKDGSEIRKHWREIAASNELLQNVVSAVKLREGMLYPTLQAYIAHAAGQPRNNPVMIGAGAIVEILKTAGLLTEEAGELVATFDEEPGSNGFTEAAPEDAVPIATTQTREGPTVNIHLHVQCDADQIEDLAPRLKRLLEELSGASPRKEDPQGL